MLSSHKAVSPRRLHSSSAKAVVTDPIAATTFYSPFSPMTYHHLCKRNFSWGAKHKLGSKNAGKVWKGFSTHDHTRSQKQLYQGTFWNRHYVSHLRPYLQVQEWRLSSSWGKPGTAYKKSDQAPTPSTKTKGEMEEDWYCNYQQQKKKQYDEFMKKMEDDPIAMLFGRRWANWIDGAEAKLANASAQSAQRDDVLGKSKRTYWDGRYGRAAIRVKISRDKDATKQQQPSTVGDQSQERDYEIDPITNRKVPKPPSRPKMSPIATVPPTTEVAPELSTHAMPEVPTQSTSSMRTPAQETKESFDILVRRFVPPTDKSTLNSQTKSEPMSTEAELERRKSPHSQRPKSWLAEEGFGLKQEAKSDDHSTLNTADIKPKASIARIESALDRHVQANSPNKPELSLPVLQYNPRENTAEDIDLLRSSDVRASAGLRGKAPKQSDDEKRARQRKLEEEHRTREVHRESQLAQEMAGENPQQNLGSMREVTTREAPSEKPRALKEKHDEHNATTAEWVNEISDREATLAPKRMETIKNIPEAAITEKANKIKAQTVPLKVRLDAVKAYYDDLRQQWLDEKLKKEEKAAKKARDMHEEEVDAQKVAMNAMEMRCFGSTSKQNKAVAHEIDGAESGHKPVRPQLQSLLPGEGDMASNVHEFASRDRWYKRKAPHASDELDARFERLARDKALIQKVRGIYEDTYGTIDTNHRQPPQGEEVPRPLSTPEAQVSASSSTSLPLPDGVGLSAPTKSCRPLSGEISQPLQAFHASLLGNNSGSDPLAIIQKLFNELRQAQAVLQDRSASSQYSEALAFIQKLFSELRQIQAIIKDYRNNAKQISNPEDFATMLQTVRRACNSSSDMTSKSAEKVASFGEEAPGVDSSPALQVDHSLKSKSFKPLTIYRILAFDPAKQDIVFSKATSLAPFHPLLPVESLKLLNNPGKFLPHLITLHNMGFTLVAGTNNTLVFQRPANAQEFNDSEREQVMRGVDYVDLMGVPNRIAGGCRPDMTWEDVKAMRNQQHENPPESFLSPSASSAPPEPTSPASAAAATCSTDSATSESAKSKPAAPTPVSNLPSGSRVHREEAVFSGRSRGNWQESERRRTSRKHKRAEKRVKRSKLKNVLVTGTVTAAFCYGVGVISQMMQH